MYWTCLSVRGKPRRAKHAAPAHAVGSLQREAKLRFSPAARTHEACAACLAGTMTLSSIGVVASRNSRDARRIGKGGLRGNGSKQRPRKVRERETSASRQMPGRSEEEEVRVEPVVGLEVAKAQGSPFAKLEARRAAYGQAAARLELGARVKTAAETAPFLARSRFPYTFRQPGRCVS